MEIKASSLYNWDTIKKFNQFYNFKKSKLKRAFKFIYPFFLSIFLISFIAAVIGNYVDAELIALLVIQIFIALIFYLVYIVLPKANFNKNTTLKNSENTFVFKETEFKVAGFSNLYNGNSEIKYDGLHNVFETKEFIYLYITPYQAYIVDKAKIEEGKEKELRELLLNAIGEKYKMVFK